MNDATLKPRPNPKRIDPAGGVVLIDDVIDGPVSWVECDACKTRGPRVDPCGLDFSANDHRSLAVDLWDALPRDDPAAWRELGPVASGRGDATRAEITLEDMR